MRGDLVSLEACTDDDFQLISDWSASTVSTYSSGSPQFLSADQLRQAVRQGGMHYLMIATHDGARVGAVNWGPLAYEGSYTIGSAIGASGLWTQGHGVEANVLLLNYLFHAKNAHRVQLTLGLHNRQMVQIIAHGGFTLEGVLRDYFFLDGRHWDAVVCSLLREEFYALARTSELGLAADVVPATEKAEARRLFLEHLDRTDARYLRDVYERR
ncbi:GNAT family N-acetyltransferase [Streptomyces sp. TRM72054]|uniref:GNAT family N-acetyltransferase n=1 Tax=Streptomyces TaxID=1883 RepID=UPI00148828F0|nr:MULTISPECIES: GNAT family protein [Streptomyces]MBX9397652.1 GNAT family N-acetyltransferase [Streptomyces sp. TRM72054]